MRRNPRGYRPQVILAELQKVNDDGAQQVVDHKGLAGEDHTEVYRPQYFGSTSVPPKGSTGVVISPDGERNRSVFIGGEHDDYRPKKLKPGQKAAYDQSGNITTWGHEDGRSTVVKKGNYSTAVEEGDHGTTLKKGKLSIEVKEKEISFKAKKDSSLEITDGKMTVKAKNDVEVNADGKVTLGETTTNGNHSVKGLLSAARGLSTGALEVAPDEDGGLTQATMGLEVSGGLLKLPGFLVADLVADYPAADNIGGRAYVIDANATTLWSTVAGGGSNVLPVFSNGVNWVIG
jgi:phage baseplate assembly protein V